MNSIRQFVVALAVSMVFASCTSPSSSTEPETATTDPTTTDPTTSTDGPPVTAEPLPDIDPAPNAPVGVLVVNTSNGSIEIAWDPSRDDSVTEYEVARVSPAGSTERFTLGASTFVDAELDDGDVFTYRVVAIGPGGRSPGSETVTAQVGVDSNPPKRPGRPTFVDSDASVAFQWAPVTDISGIDRYVVTRAVDGETVDIDNATSTNFTDDIEPGWVATYSVRAVDGAGNESESSRSVTVLTGSAADKVVLVVSAESDPAATPATARLRDELLAAGYTLSWFEDDLFDSNITTSDDVVLLLGDVKGDGFDWNVFGTDATIIGLKSMFVQAGGITENPPKLDRLAQLDYIAPGTVEREVTLTATGRPKPVVYIPPNEQLPSLEIWARPVWSTDIAVAGLIQKGAELANEKPAPGCRAFFPGNAESLSEQTEDGWQLLIDFVGEISAAC